MGTGQEAMDTDYRALLIRRANALEEGDANEAHRLEVLANEAYARSLAIKERSRAKAREAAAARSRTA